ncbi:MAG: hypothetical protein ACFFCV_17305 [Promethearchaeota archaeon]
MISIKIVRIVIYLLFILTVILIFLNPNLTEFSGYWQIRSTITTVLTIMFTTYIRIDRIKRKCMPFKKWLKSIQPQLVFLSNHYIIKKSLNEISEELVSLNQRIERFEKYLKPTLKTIEIVGYFITITTTFIPLFFNSPTILEFFPNISVSILSLTVLLIPYFYYHLKDINELKNSGDIINVNSEMDLMLKSISDAYFSNK